MLMHNKWSLVWVWHNHVDIKRRHTIDDGRHGEDNPIFVIDHWVDRLVLDDGKVGAQVAVFLCVKGSWRMEEEKERWGWWGDGNEGVGNCFILAMACIQPLILRLNYIMQTEQLTRQLQVYQAFTKYHLLFPFSPFPIQFFKDCLCNNITYV